MSRRHPTVEAVDDVAFSSERCHLRNWRDDDVERVFDMYRQWEVARWLGSEPKPMESVDQARALVERWSAFNDQNPVAGRWAVERKHDNVVAGTVILVPLPDGTGEFEVGWHLHPDCWRQGLASEAAQAVLARGFSKGLTEVFAVVRPDNVRSLAVCRRLGMQALGRTSTYYGTELRLFVVRPH
jgi:RimJ/RimL family protein N-acetyltransferase